ncbi:MAG: hypothetical protein IKI85_03410, partial [Bacteroidales bacterium]|nr:hypothetical protein [Bacteroidales bacterium]
LQYSKTDVTVPFNDGVIQAAAETGIIACFGDGLAPQTVPGALASMEKYGAAVMPVLNPLPNTLIIDKLETIESTSAAAVSVVVAQMLSRRRSSAPRKRNSPNSGSR